MWANFLQFGDLQQQFQVFILTDIVERSSLVCPWLLVFYAESPTKKTLEY